MTPVTNWIFGVFMPGLEVLLTLLGLGLLGWEGVVYTVTGRWPAIALGAVGAGWLPHWLAAWPLPGTCIGLAIALFFVMPPAYAHA